MGKASLIAILAFGLMGAYYTISAQQGMLDTEGRVADHQVETLSRNAAHAGMSRAQQALADDFSSSTFTGEYDSVPYEVRTIRDGNTATIEAVGRATSASGEEKPFHIKKVFRREVIPPMEVPSYQKYAALSDGNLTLGGNVDAGIYAEGSESNKLNANMHSNNELRVDGNAAHVEGFGTYTVGASGKLDAFDPTHNPNDAEPVQQSPEVEVPDFDIEALASSMEQYHGNYIAHEGDYKFDGSTHDHGGTREEPAVLHVKGDLVVNGNSSVTGHTMFIVDGNIRVTGGWTLRADPGQYDGPDESSIAIYAGGGVHFGGNSELWTQLYVKGDVTSDKGSPEVYGNITALGDIELGGSPHIYYRQASTALVVEDLDTQTHLITHNEW